MWLGFLAFGVTLFFLLAKQLFPALSLSEAKRKLVSSEKSRRRVAMAAVFAYLVLLALHLVWPEALVVFLVSSAIVLIFFASQLFWLRRVSEIGEARLPRKEWANWFRKGGMAVYIILFSYNLPWWPGASEPTRLTLGAALFQAPFRWWFVSSLLGFLVVLLFWVADRVVRMLRWAFKRVAGKRIPSAHNPEATDPVSRGRRQFLEKAAVAISASPFVAGAYGLFYGRLNLEVVRKRVRLERLPKAFDGIRIAQISDLHIGPFMSEDEIRKYVGIANELRPDLFLLTGDYVTWDPATQGSVVNALSGLKAPLGVFGCLGNHELWTDTEASITRLFAARGIRILRQERAPLALRGETVNLIGVDFRSARDPRLRGLQVERRYLRGVEKLLMPGTVNILLTHNPNSFDRAAELGIDLSLAGHTHGGQVTLEFIHPSLSPSRLITSYVKGWFQKGRAQLYVNRGIGTIGVPMRIGAPPEITIFELAREA